MRELSEYQAWCCGLGNRRPNGTVAQTKCNFHLDHLNPSARPAPAIRPPMKPLCTYHNILKGYRRLHPDDHRKSIRQNGEMLVSDVSELIEPDEALPEPLTQASNVNVPARYTAGVIAAQSAP